MTFTKVTAVFVYLIGKWYYVCMTKFGFIEAMAESIVPTVFLSESERQVFFTGEPVRLSLERLPQEFRAGDAVLISKKFFSKVVARVSISKDGTAWELKLDSKGD